MKFRVIIMRLAGTIFGIVAILHLLRILLGTEVIIDGWLLPLWVNWIGFIGTGALSAGLWYFSWKN